MTSVPSVEQAVSASIACVEALGIEVRSSRVIAAGYSVRVLLEPAQIVTRVMTEGQILRGDPVPWLQREVAVASYLDAVGAAIVAPWPSPGPHHSEGLDVTLWQWVEPRDGVVSQAAFATMLFDLHQSLEGFTADLPVLVGPLTDIGTALKCSDDPVLHEAAARLVPEAMTWPRRPVHGDAHTGNVLNTAAGFRWLDFEDACLAPIEWDFASLTITDEAVAAYSGRLDRQLLQRCRQLRRLQVLAAVLTDDLNPEAEALRAELVTALSMERG